MARRASGLGRWTDRVEDVAAWMLLAAGLLVLLFGCALGIHVNDRLAQQGRDEARDCSPAVATLLDAAPTIPSAYATGSPVGVTATWQDRLGVAHTGLVPAPQGLDAGRTVSIWIDRSGTEVPAPTSAADSLGVAAITAGMAIAAAVSILACVWDVVRRITLAYDCAAWEREWREVAPIWSRGEGKRG